MVNIAMSPNHREAITAISSITGKDEYLFSTGHALNVAGTFSLAGSTLPISGATTAIGVAIVDGSGNQITSFGGGTQYAEGVTTKPATGTAFLGRYESAPSGTSTDNGLYPPLMDNFHQLKVVPVGTVTISGSVTQGTSPWVVGQSTAANLNATVVGTGTFAVQATLAPETTKVIGTVNQGTSPWVTTANPAGSTSATTANVAGSVTSVTALASNANRREAIFYNDSASDCYLKYGTTASSTSFTYYLPSLSTLSFTGTEYTGRVDVIWISAVGNLRVTETTP